MGLALGLYKNEILRIGDGFLKIVDINGIQNFKVAKCSRDGKVIGAALKITPLQARELWCGVMVCAGVGTHCMARMVVSAPKSVKIERLGKHVGNT